MIGQDSQEWIVITSDREIMDHAWKNRSVPVSSDKFFIRLGHTDLTDDDEFHEEDDSVKQRKGSPRQRSKKEKALLRILNKL